MVLSSTSLPIFSKSVTTDLDRQAMPIFSAAECLMASELLNSPADCK